MSLNKRLVVKAITTISLGLGLFACANIEPKSSSSTQEIVGTPLEESALIAPSNERKKAFDSLAKKALSAQKKGKHEKALERWQKISQEFPEFESAPLNMAICYLKLGQLDEANANLAKALLIQPDHVDALIEQAYVRRRQGQINEAKALYEQALLIAPENPRLSFNLAMLYDLYLDQPQQALRFYQQFLDLSKGGNSDPDRIQKVTQWLADLERRIK